MRKIYYIDDDFEDIEIFTAAVKKMEEESVLKVDLRVYSEGIKLLKELNEIKPENDLVFLDINMPLKNGFEILTEIRRYVELCKLPVIMYSTASDSQSISISQELGANLYAVKPCSIKSITNLIKHVAEIEWDSFTFGCLKFID
jgi:DNA-binding response OmpR family regulator